MEADMAIDDAYYARIRQIESGGNDNARNKSGASGRYQFMPATWAALGLKAVDIMRPEAQEQAIRKFTGQNYAALQKGLGREPEPWELYMAHQQGAGGALGLLRGDGSAPLSRNQLANNPFGAKTRGEWLNGWQNKYNGGRQEGRVPFPAPKPPREKELARLKDKDGTDLPNRVA